MLRAGSSPARDTTTRAWKSRSGANYAEVPRSTEPLEGADDPLVGVLGILAVGAPEMEAAREAEGAHHEVHLRLRAHDRRPGGRPVRLQLAARLCLEPDGRAACAQPALRMNVVPQDRDAARIALGLQPDTRRSSASSSSR
jgi:hypothetical protein